MSDPLRIRPEAEADIAEAKAWYEARQSGLGEDFVLRVEQFFDRIRRFPRLYPVVYRDVRAALIRRFPYLVCYPVQDDETIEVIAVPHGRQNAWAWKRRV